MGKLGVSERFLQDIVLNVKIAMGRVSENEIK